MEDQKLKEYFKFDEADLYANRNGELSERQKKSLSSRQTEAIHQKRVAFAIGFPVSVILIGWMMFRIYQSYRGVGVDSVLTFWLGLCGFPLLVAVLYIFRLSFIRQKYVMKKVEGPINIIKEDRHTSDGHHYTAYELHIGGETFKTTSELGDVVMQGDVYAVYYSVGEVSGFREIRSAEMIGKAK